MATAEERSIEGLGRHARADATPAAGVARVALSRRHFLAGGLTLGLGVLTLQRSAAAGRLALAPGPSPLSAELAPSAVLRLRRPEDLLWMDVELYGCEIDGRAIKAVDDATLVLVLQAQAILEEAIYLDPAIFADGYFDGYQDTAQLLGRAPGPGRLRAALAGPSRLAFSVPTGTEIDLSTTGILDSLAGFEPRVVGTAQPVLEPVVRVLTLLSAGVISRRLQPTFDGPVPVPTSPGPTETAIEAPWDVVLSPSAKGAWAHMPQPETEGRRTELWHTRLGVRGDDGRPDETLERERIVRAVGTRGRSDPFPSESMPLTAADRDQIVQATTTFSRLGSSPEDFWPEPVHVEALSLSTLGASLDLSGDWNPNGFPATAGVLSLEQWKHRTTTGRDQFVRVVRRGYLFPFGHRVSLVEETERRFVGGTKPTTYLAGYLFKRAFIVVRERVKRFGGTLGQPSGGRGLPFRELRLVTRTTPPLDDRFAPHPFPFPFGTISPQPDHPTGPDPAMQPFLPSVQEAPFEFAFSAVDWDGHRSQFRAPAVFVFHGWWAYDSDALGAVADTYAARDSLRRRRFNGQTVALAPARGNGSTARISAGGPSRDAAQAVKEAVFKSVWATKSATTLDAADQPAFFPEMEEMTVALSTAQETVGAQVAESADLGDLVIAYADRYLTHGFTTPTSSSRLVASNANHGEVYAVVHRALGRGTLAFSADRAGGIVTPVLQVVGLSRALGPVSAAGGVGRDAQAVLDTVAANEFDPAQLLPPSAKLLGVLPLSAIARKVSGYVDSTGTVSGQALQLTTTRTDKLFEKRMEWDVPLRDDLPVIEVTAASSLKFQAYVRVSGTLLPPNPRLEVLVQSEGGLVNVTLQVLVVEIVVRRFGFRQSSTSMLDVDLDIAEVRFGDVLEFIRQLAELLPNPKQFAIDASDTGITAAYGLEIPKMSVGVFALGNIAFRAGLDIPFNGQPVVLGFAFASPENPFYVSVGIFGGKGYALLKLKLGGFERLEASFEFGVTASIDLGVASGQASMMGGIYFALDAGGNATLKGFLHISGRVSVLDLVTISIDVNLALGYQSAGNKVVGEASLRIKITIGFIPINIPPIRIRRTFSEDGSDPPFGDQMDESDWSAYAAAFAAAGS